MPENLDKLIPDFDELEDMAKLAAEAKRKSTGLEHKIKQLEAEFISEALANREYWKEGKRPTVTYCNSVVKEIGNTEGDREQLIELRNRQAEQERLYHYLNSLIEIRRDKLALYRTESANKRKAYL